MNQSKETVAQQLARAASAFEERRTGHAPQAVTVVLSEDTLVIALHGAWPPAARTCSRSRCSRLTAGKCVWASRPRKRSPSTAGRCGSASAPPAAVWTARWETLRRRSGKDALRWGLQNSLELRPLGHR